MSSSKWFGKWHFNNKLIQLYEWISKCIIYNATFKIRILTVIENKSLDQSFVNFLKKALREIDTCPFTILIEFSYFYVLVDLVAQSNVNHLDKSFLVFSLYLI
jgi:hypothetical protein